MTGSFSFFSYMLVNWALGSGISKQEIFCAANFNKNRFQQPRIGLPKSKALTEQRQTHTLAQTSLVLRPELDPIP